MVKSFFRSSPPLNITINQTIRKLKFQHAKLEQGTIRLREKDKALFHKCVMAIGEKQRERATILATELGEIRKVLNMLVQTQLAIERIILRLETIRELSDVMVDLVPALRNLKNVTKSLYKIMPKMAHELEKVNDSISETLAVTRVNSSHPIMPLDLKTPASEEILKEATMVLEERLTESLPEPPVSITATEKVESKGKIRQMVALTASCQEVHKPEKPISQGYFSRKDVELQRVSLTIEQSSSKRVLEDALLEYAKESKGEIDAVQCANELNVPYKVVMETLDRLGHEGKIKVIQR